MQMKIRILSILSVCLLAFVCLILTSCQKEADTTAKVTGPIIDSVASSDGVMIHYEVIGKGEPTLFLVHGWSCDRSYWKNQVGEFAKTNQVVTIDLGGHGKSGAGRENWTIAAFGDDVAAVVNKVNPDKLVILGHSFAGSVIMQAAKQLSGRVIGLVGVDTYHNLEMEFSSEQIAGATAAFRADFVSTVDGYVRSIFSKNADSSLVEQVASHMSAAPPEIAINVVENYLAVNPVEILKEVRVPIRAINAEKPETNIENNQKYAVSFEVKLMPNVGHFVQLEDPSTFNRLLHETLDELTGKSGAQVDKK